MKEENATDPATLYYLITPLPHDSSFVMTDLGQTLEANVDTIIARWTQKVQLDPEIESAKQLAHEAVRNSLPDVLNELARLLSTANSADLDRLEHKSLCHGVARARQGYDTSEIIREYRLLRKVVLSVLEPHLLEGSARELLSSLNQINDVFDEIVNDSIESYIDARIAELKQLQGQLTLTNQELTRLVQTHKDHLSFMAHELKTPLTSIIGHSSMLLRKERAQLQVKDSTTTLAQLERVLRNGRCLLEIINNTLEVARFDEGMIRLNLSPVEPGHLIPEIIEDGLAPLAAEKGLTLAVDCAAAPTKIMSDSLRLQQIVMNLVSNAIRHTESGAVRVICRQVDDTVWEMQVTDTGVGIPEKVLANIFQPFVTSEHAVHESGAGTGLGLAIVKQIVALMAGEIVVDSEVGVGTTFKVTLPLVQSSSADRDLPLT